MSKPYKIGWKPQNYERRVASARIRCLNTLRQLGRQHFPAELYSEKNESDYRIVVFSKAYTNKEIVIAKRLRDKRILEPIGNILPAEYALVYYQQLEGSSEAA